MPYFEIIVQYSTGEASSGSRVVLSGDSGVTETAYTDSNGKAVLETPDSRPSVYVDGWDCGRVSPGRSIVTAR